MSKGTRYVLAATRIVFGWIFIWSFFDKLLGLGFSTTPDKAWVVGGSPTAGFLGNAVTGPLEDIYHSIAGTPLVDGLFMIGLAAIGIALIFGVASRITATAGALLMLLMWSAVLPPEQNPIIDDHIIYALLFVILAVTNAGDTLGLGRWWKKLPLVKQLHVLQ